MMKTYKPLVIVVTIIIILSESSFGQHKNQKTILAFYNISLGSTVGAFGAIMNKKKHEKWYTVFLKGFIQGGVGGYLTYEGKRLVYKINKHENLIYGWSAKLLHSTGASIIENAALNKNFWDSWNLHFGFLRFEIKPKSPNIALKFLPVGLYGFVASSFLGKFNLKKTLQLGTPYFESNGQIYDKFSGMGHGNDIIINKQDYFKYSTIAHEFVHDLQFREYISINSNLNVVNKKLMKMSFYRKFSKFIYLDIPYHWLIYTLEGNYIDYNCQYKNFFELEAEYFATLKPVNICH